MFFLLGWQKKQTPLSMRAQVLIEQTPPQTVFGGFWNTRGSTYRFFTFDFTLLRGFVFTILLGEVMVCCPLPSQTY